MEPTAKETRSKKRARSADGDDMGKIEGVSGIQKDAQNDTEQNELQKQSKRPRGAEEMGENEPPRPDEEGQGGAANAEKEEDPEWELMRALEDAIERDAKQAHAQVAVPHVEEDDDYDESD